MPLGTANRAMKTIPVEDCEIKTSSILNAGLGVFAKRDIPTRARFGPYEGVTVKDKEAAQRSGYSWLVSLYG